MGSDFWTQVEIKPEIIVHETRDYLVVVTPTFWRDRAREGSDRNLTEYSIINKQYGTIESGSNNLPSAIITCKTLQETLEDVTKKETRNANIVGFPSKDRTD